MTSNGVRMDRYPTHSIKGVKFRAGHALPFGTSLIPGGVNFSVYSNHATACTLVLFEKGAREPRLEIPLPEAFRTGNVWSITVFDLDIEMLEYGYRMEGPFQPERGHRFDSSKVLLDPYARAVGGRDRWLTPQEPGTPYPFRSSMLFEDFDWEDDIPPDLPMEDLVIYETHVRGFTRHSSSGVRAPGTFAGLKEKIPYLKALGVNCVELMPIFEFDEWEHSRRLPDGSLTVNYWGYSTMAFFAPKAGYAATGHMGMQADELKTLVKALHAEGIEVILDVVFNHTNEGNELGPTLSFRGLDNKTYYMLTPDGRYYNFSGCGNTLNCNNPVVRSMVLDCLRYWVAEYHIDGFRFDLAAILNRDQNGAPLTNPPLLETLAFDPILGRTKLIAEAWDPGGLYQVGSFPNYGRWAEWNGPYRDTLRRFLTGEEGQVAPMTQRVEGSPDLYWWRATNASINFITSHDGFTLYDLFAYSQKHNLANGEDNRDGENNNISWNCGFEGETNDPEINALRLRLVRNAYAILMTSQGVPLIVAGDEFGRTQKGNNNAYCQDNEISWLDWTLAEKNADLLRFVRGMIHLRRDHPILRKRTVYGRGGGAPYPQLSFHGTRPWYLDRSGYNRVLAWMLEGETADGTPDAVYVAVNMYWDGLQFVLPACPGNREWRVAANTSLPSPQDFREPGTETPLETPGEIIVGPRSVMVLVST
ncbi:glycogen debranching protein GlgX [Phaeovibrio sulfidiphilus]|uniref:Glycogen debranching protein GlgX n=1 Tax=Phaeovibrio sulfidiphilus TaxID=1220600 RepID=A0A8J6YLL8_9PROT|nr:glycogen debranching protein GlgX [Phaeovibrio sulfidiphilus]MBE1236650.1 glycogen debranching protein GlgX [Phaeovibrio sulfidiphilus]